jgi:hypothetical protein
MKINMLQVTIFKSIIKTNKDKFNRLKDDTKTMDLHYLSSAEAERHFETSTVKLNI